MDVWKRRSVVVALTTWGKLVIAVVGGVALDRWSHLDVPRAYAAWVVAGAVTASLVSLLPALEASRPEVRQRSRDLRTLLLLSDVVVTSGWVSVTGGIRSPFWVLYALSLTGLASMARRQWDSVVSGLVVSTALAAACTVAHTMRPEDLPFVLSVAALFPLAAWLEGTLTLMVHDLRRTARAEHDALQEQVGLLSSAMARAASGDLAVVNELARSGEHEGVGQLSAAFAETLDSLRSLVAQIRNGGDQITTSAGDLLEAARAHSTSASEQASAVTETTSTIEELAATAAQIAETAEAVARYAAETLTHADEGRTAVTASVDAMAGLAERVNTITTRALTLGDKS